MNRPALSLFLVLAAWTWPTAPARAEGVPGAGVYVFEVTVAPVCLDGTYTATIATGAGPVSGPLSVSTDVHGRLSGTLTLSGSTFDVHGSAVSTSRSFTLSLAAKSGKDHLTLHGKLDGTSFSGTAQGRGAIAKGRNPFTIDVSSARSATATLVADLVAARGRNLRGSGSASLCGAPLTLTASGTTGRSFSFALRTKGLRFSGHGRGPVAWKFRGFGASASGEGLAVTQLDPPASLTYSATTPIYEEGEAIAANSPTAPMPPQTTFSITPSLPVGLAIDVATGVISGTPLAPEATATYAVTAANPAGSAQAVLTIGVRISRAKSFAAETSALTDDDLRHFLRRTQHGVRQAELDALRSQGLTAYLDAMLVFPTDTTAEQNAFPLLVNSTDPVGLEGQFPNNTQIARWWTQIMVDTEAPFQETLALFWNDHFGVSSTVLDGGEHHWMTDHVNLLRREGIGNLRTLLVDVARDPAMLAFLNGLQNTRGRPNENFAREFWELFTLGVGNGYTQAEIKEASRAWTGWKETTDATTGLSSVTFDTNRHDAGEKTFFGQTIAPQSTTDDFAAVVDITLGNRQVAEFVARKLFEAFCYENPPQSLVDTMAADLRAQDYELRPFLRALLRSEAFFSKTSRRALVKSPVEFTVGFLRSTGLRMTTAAGALDVATLDNSLNSQGQRPTQPPTVAGWPSGDLWLSAQEMVERINVVQACVNDVADQAKVGIDVASLLPPVADRTADAVVDTLAALLDVQLSAKDHADCVEYLNTTRDAAGNVTASPFDGSSQTQLDERVRGLVYVLAQHPSYQSR